jgi:hypothetical protein
MMTRKFSDVVGKFCQDTPKRIDMACVKITRLLFKTVIEYTPVSDGTGHEGRLVGNWQTMINGYNHLQQARYSPTRSGPLRRMQSTVNLGTFLRDDAYVTMTNSTDYAYRAEYLGWREYPYAGKKGLDGMGSPYRMVARGMLDITTKLRSATSISAIY